MSTEGRIQFHASELPWKTLSDIRDQVPDSGHDLSWISIRLPIWHTVWDGVMLRVKGQVGRTVGNITKKESRHDIGVNA